PPGSRPVPLGSVVRLAAQGPRPVPGNRSGGRSRGPLRLSPVRLRAGAALDPPRGVQASRRTLAGATARRNRRGEAVLGPCPVLREPDLARVRGSLARRAPVAPARD